MVNIGSSPHLRLVGDNLWSFEIMAPTRDPGRDQRTPADILFIYPPVVTSVWGRGRHPFVSYLIFRFEMRPE